MYLNHFISLVLGFLTLTIIYKDRPSLKPALTLLLSWGVGLGISVYLTFLSFILFKTFHPEKIYLFHGILFLGLFLGAFPTYKRHFKRIPHILFETINQRLFDALTWIFWTILLCLTYMVTEGHTFGEWDAWGMWNLKTKFLLLSAQPFEDIFHNLHWHTHPDYPLFLPFLNTWVYGLSSTDLHPIPLYTAIIFTLACGILLYLGLLQFIPKIPAFIAGALLATNPFFGYQATAQYADVQIGFYLLAGFILMVDSLSTKKPQSFFLFGIILGFMTFIKNEGILMMLFLTGLTLLSFGKEVFQHKRVLLWFFLALGLTFIPTLYFKTFLAPPNDDILPNFAWSNLRHYRFMNLQIFFTSTFQELTHKKWCWIWIFSLSALLLNLPKLIFEEKCRGLFLFFVIYFFAIAAIYTTNTNISISWWLESSLARIIFSLLPSLLFLIFYSYWHKPKNLNHL
ncbi:MAG: glycosyltransferase family 39 protein [Candidatus Omnitrophica bacterium]|nr:glycosyltransferase family 39 protein [Candidatus Omnitrophota bacterium]